MKKIFDIGFTYNWRSALGINTFFQTVVCLEHFSSGPWAGKDCVMRKFRLTTSTMMMCRGSMCRGTTDGFAARFRM